MNQFIICNIIENLTPTNLNLFRSASKDRSKEMSENSVLEKELNNILHNSQEPGGATGIVYQSHKWRFLTFWTL